MTTGSPVAELVPIADRVRWMLGCRALLVVTLFVVWLGVDGVGTPIPLVVWAGVLWLMTSGLMSVSVLRPTGREGGGRWFAVVGFTLGLLGDGLLLAAATYTF